MVFELGTSGQADDESGSRHQYLAAGTHVFEVRATDQAGNIDPTPAARSFKVIIRGGGKGGGG